MLSDAGAAQLELRQLSGVQLVNIRVTPDTKEWAYTPSFGGIPVLPQAGQPTVNSPISLIKRGIPGEIDLEPCQKLAKRDLRRTKGHLPLDIPIPEVFQLYGVARHAAADVIAFAQNLKISVQVSQLCLALFGQIGVEIIHHFS